MVGFCRNSIASLPYPCSDAMTEVCRNAIFYNGLRSPALWSLMISLIHTVFRMQKVTFLFGTAIYRLWTIRVSCNSLFSHGQ
jgi:hypothetical protein